MFQNNLIHLNPTGLTAKPNLIRKMGLIRCSPSLHLISWPQFALWTEMGPRLVGICWEGIGSQVQGDPIGKGGESPIYLVERTGKA